ncbi:MAG: hypothetical protein IJJ41_09370 [Clostridia bacterium]|nr:hypothetical protein [Clostridia bacterium]
MKKLLVMLCAVAVIFAAFTGCSAGNKDTSTTSDQTLTPTTDMSQKVSEEMTDISEKVSEEVTDASEKASEAASDISENMNDNGTTSETTK